MSSLIMRFWLKRRDKLIHNYLLVGYLLSPNLTIIAHVNDNRSEIHQKAVVSLIKRLFLSPLLVGADRTRCLAVVVNTFWDEFACFTTILFLLSLHVGKDTARCYSCLLLASAPFFPFNEGFRKAGVLGSLQNSRHMYCRA